MIAALTVQGTKIGEDDMSSMRSLTDGSRALIKSMVRQREFEWPGLTWRCNVTAAVKYLEAHALLVETTQAVFDHEYGVGESRRW